jgi:hypothetical protein
MAYGDVYQAAGCVLTWQYLHAHVYTHHTACAGEGKGDALRNILAAGGDPASSISEALAHLQAGAAKITKDYLNKQVYTSLLQLLVVLAVLVLITVRLRCS